MKNSSSKIPAYAIYICFFFSGFSALIYEVAWLNRVQLLVGHSVYSMATTLAAYMGGIALGALLVPAFRRSEMNSFSLYLLAELLIGLYGLIFYPLLKLVRPLYLLLSGLSDSSAFLHGFAQFLFCAGLILIPTILMGTTLPLLVNYLSSKKNDISLNLPKLYTVNAAGAAVGCFCTGFILLPNLGYTQTSLVAAGMNIILCLVMIYAFSPSLKFSPGHFREIFHISQFKRVALPRFNQRWHFLVVLFISGMASMLMQVIWNRLTSLGVGPSVYIYPMVTTVVLLGVAVGSLLWSRILTKSSDAQKYFILLPVFASLSWMVSIIVLGRTPHFMLYVLNEWAPAFWKLTFFEMTWLIVALLPAAITQGALFPSAMSLMTADESSESGTSLTSEGVMVNVLGLVIGGLLGSLYIIPTFGIETTTQLLVGTLALCSVLLSLTMPHKTWQRSLSIGILGLGVTFVTPAMDWNVLTAGYFYNRDNIPALQQLKESGWLEWEKFESFNTYKIVDRADDAHATISIHDDQARPGFRSFKINGKVDGSVPGDLFTTRFVALLPIIVKPHAKSALVIGLGTGSTAATALKYPLMEKVKVIELSQGIIDFSRKYFPRVDGDNWNDPRFSVLKQDGRTFIETTEENFDLIISEPSNPWVDGEGKLFTREYFRGLSEKLNVGGVASVWFHLYNLECDTVMSVLGAAAESFKHVLVFRTNIELFILGSNDDFFMNPIPNIEGAMPLTQELFRQIGNPPTESLVYGYMNMARRMLIYDKERIQQAMGSLTINTDENQLLQFSAGRTYNQKIYCMHLPEPFKKNDENPYVRKILNRQW